MALEAASPRREVSILAETQHLSDDWGADFPDVCVCVCELMLRKKRRADHIWLPRKRYHVIYLVKPGDTPRVLHNFSDFSIYTQPLMFFISFFCVCTRAQGLSQKMKVM